MSRFLVRAVAVATGTTLVASSARGVRVQLRLRLQRHVLGLPGRRAAAGRHGHIRATQVGAGQNPAYSTTINGYGGIKVWVSTNPRGSTAS